VTQYMKFIFAVVATIASAVSAAVVDGHVTNVELVNIGIAALGAIGVVIVPNLPDGIAAYSKSIVAALMAVATALVGFLVAGPVTASEVVQLVVIALAAIGVFVVPNQTSRRRVAA
jgi:hypothetical protein